MTTDADIELTSRLTALILADVRHRKNGFALDDERLIHHAVVLSRLRGIAERKCVAIELLALVLKYERISARHTTTVRAQLLLLFSIAAGDLAKQILARVSIDRPTARVVGAEISKLPVGATGPVAGSFSPLGLRLIKKTDNVT